MRSMSSLIHKLKSDYPAMTFFKSDDFAWSPSIRTVSYNPELPHAAALTLHELSHGLLDHTEYKRDIELIAFEVAAWEKARELAAKYHIDIPENVIEDSLDTYRDWMHARSTCPACSATGYQITRDSYACPACTHEWRVNEARLCALRRYKKKPTKIPL